MASSGKLSPLLLPLLFTLTSAATFDVVNGCPYTVWAAALRGGGRQLNSGETWTLNVNPGTASARIWARTGCSFDGSGRGECLTGDCGGVLQCQLSGRPPATVAGYTLNQVNNLDFFHISLVDGFNVPMNFSPISGGCRGVSCTADIKGQCPEVLKAPGGCNNPSALSEPIQYHCTSGSCVRPTIWRFFKDWCPDAIYRTGDETSTFNCAVGTNYRVVFCHGAMPKDGYSLSNGSPKAMPPKAMPPKAMPELHSVAGKKKHASKILVIVIISAVSAVLVFLFATVICLKRRRPKKEVVNAEDEELIRSAESMSFSFGTLRTATGNFCDANKLGQGGFGPVYKGVLPDGQRIAVKRLLRSSNQGLSELRNEVLLVAKLHHRNLVRLVGFCLEEAEKMVVYEYLPNTSLDKFLFDPNKRLQLDWERRYKLIEGIARGLVYLHEETRFRIIHRDLKASNILLDERMNPKISDFGLAKIFGVDETHGNTNRIAGTYGYMAPEYAMHGHFSIKSDVFSFGVLVLEIVTGRRNRGFQETEDATDLLSYVWRHWNEGAALQLLDPSIVERSQEQEVLRCIHIGLLCVQEDPSERPNMSEVCLMLINTVMLPTPSRPAFLRGRVTRNDGVLLRGNDSTSSQDMEQRGVQSENEVSISDLEPR